MQTNFLKVTDEELYLMVNVGDTKKEKKKKDLASAPVELVHSMHTVLFLQASSTSWGRLNQLIFSWVYEQLPSQPSLYISAKVTIGELIEYFSELSRNEPEDGLRAQLVLGESCSYLNKRHESVISSWTSSPFLHGPASSIVWDGCSLVLEQLLRLYQAPGESSCAPMLHS